MAPGTKATENYISATHGIYEFIRDANVPNGQVGTGNFEIDGEFYNGDPFNGRSDDGYAGSQTVTFTAVETFDVSSTPRNPPRGFCLVLALAFSLSGKAVPPDDKAPRCRSRKKA